MSEQKNEQLAGELERLADLVRRHYVHESWEVDQESHMSEPYSSLVGGMLEQRDYLGVDTWSITVTVDQGRAPDGSLLEVHGE